ncbi:valine N-monooxygenase 1-like protein [Tanacetum coccineum]
MLSFSTSRRGCPGVLLGSTMSVTLLARLVQGFTCHVSTRDTTVTDRHLKDGSEVVLTDYSIRMLSFSTGRRGCPGVLLGSTMSVMLLARLVQGFTWELLDCLIISS